MGFLQAKEFAKKEIESTPQRAEGHYHLGHTQFKDGKFEEAENPGFSPT